jgi:hypothetical protein
MNKGELLIYLQKKLNAEFPFAEGKGVPSLDGEAGYFLTQCHFAELKNFTLTPNKEVHNEKQTN